MVVKTTGISRELLIHPGETIADILAERNMSQADLAASTGVSSVYVSNVIAGKKDISANFAMALEYALGVPKSFWLNLQANYDAEVLEVSQVETVTDDERAAAGELSEVVAYYRKKDLMPQQQTIEETVLCLRNLLRFSDIANLRNLVPSGSFRLAGNHAVNQTVMGAWIRMCQLASEGIRVTGRYDRKSIRAMIADIKDIMVSTSTSNLPAALRGVMADYGIAFSLIHNFRGAPVHGYVTRGANGSLQMAVTIRDSWEDVFWFSLFHEIGHIVNGDIDTRDKGFIDEEVGGDQEDRADVFARDTLLDPAGYRSFLERGDYTLNSIRRFAEEQHVKPCIVIGRLQKEGAIPWNRFTSYKPRLKWADSVKRTAANG